MTPSVHHGPSGPDPYSKLNGRQYTQSIHANNSGMVLGFAESDILVSWVVLKLALVAVFPAALAALFPEILLFAESRMASLPLPRQTFVFP